jgi:hypothetical protein
MKRASLTRVGCVLLSLITGILVSHVSLADAPILERERATIHTWSGPFEAVSDPDKNTLVVYRKVQAGRQREKVWQMDDYSDGDVFLADNGELVAFCYDGGNLLRPDAKPDQSMVRFYRRGELVRAVPLSEVIINKEALPRTVSNYRWGQFHGFFKASTRFAISTNEGRYIIIDGATGKIVETRKLSDPPKELEERHQSSGPRRDNQPAAKPKKPNRIAPVGAH